MNHPIYDEIRAMRKAGLVPCETEAVNFRAEIPAIQKGLAATANSSIAFVHICGHCDNTHLVFSVPPDNEDDPVMQVGISMTPEQAEALAKQLLNPAVIREG